MACLGIDDKAAFDGTVQLQFLNHCSEGAFTLDERPLLVDTVEKVSEQRFGHPIGPKMLMRRALKTTPRPETRPLPTFSTVSAQCGHFGNRDVILQ